MSPNREEHAPREGASDRANSASYIKVSVLVMTYNHARMIGQALDSVLTQETGFDYEVLISEDCSTDGTREIVVDYQRRFPGRIRLLLSERNLNSNAVVSRGIRACRGEFVALLDGDDYWTDPTKLRRQVEFLESHPECSECFHDTMAIYEDGSRPPRNWTPPERKKLLTLRDIWRGNPITTCATLFRNRLYQLPAWYDEMPVTDWPLHVLNAEHGAIGYIDRVMSVYRIHTGGTYSALDEINQFEKRYRFYILMNRNMNYRCDSIAREGLFFYFLEWAEEYSARGDLRMTRFCLQKCLAGRPIRKSAYRRLLSVVKCLVVQSAESCLTGGSSRR